MTAYYNEFDPYAAQWLRNLIDAGLIPKGDVDERSIVDVQPGDLAGYAQCHFFAGIGGWALAARLAGWPDDRELWTGSCPCQPFSVAGKQQGSADERHLWPHYLRLIRARRPMVVMGEQVAAAIGKDWLDGVRADLHGESYACWAIVLPACAVNSPHRRDRIWFVGDRDGAVDHGERARLEGHAGDERATRGRPFEDRSAAAACRGSDVADAAGSGREQGITPATSSRHGHIAASASRTGGSGELADADFARASEGWKQRGGQFGWAGGDPSARSAWDGAAWIIGHDGKARRVEPGIRLLAHGVPARVGRLRAYGNAIVPQVAAEVIAAYMECRP